MWLLPVDWSQVPVSNYTLAATILAFGTDYAVARLWNGNQHPLTAEKGGRGDLTQRLQTTFLYGATNSISVSARVYLALLLFDLFLARFPVMENFPSADVSLRVAAPVITVTVWFGLTMCTVKRIVLMQLVSGNRLGRVVLLDRLFDFVIFVIVSLCILDELAIDLTRGLQTVLSAGGIGALIFSLAAKDLAEQIVGGFALGAWYEELNLSYCNANVWILRDALSVGDKVKLNNGVEGYVKEIGLLETIIEGYDNIVTRIPNSQMTSARVCNLSKVNRRRESQVVRFRYSDLEKIPDVLCEIKEEIRLSCPKLSSKVLAVLRSYEKDHIEAIVRAHFDIKPATIEGLENRHDFLLAIGRAMKKKQVNFALPVLLADEQRIDSDDA